MVTEHGCESGAYCHTFLYKAHFERERERKGAQTRVQTVNLWFIREEGRKEFWQRLIFTKCYLKAIALSLVYRRGDEGT